MYQKILILTITLFLSITDIALAEDKENRDEFSHQLIGGRRATDGELPFSVFIGNCTASIVGPKVALTAGHCRSTGQTISFVIGQVRHQGSCRRHPDFNSRTLNNDFTLCIFQPEVDDPSRFASLIKANVSVSDRVTLQGFGQNDLGNLRVGDAPIVEIDGQDIITESSVKLGGGDSGGGLLLGTPDLRRGPFVIIGINSRASVRGGFSFFNRTNLDRSQDFFSGFARANNVKICGINDSCQDLDDRCSAERDIVKFFEDELDNAKEVLRQCLERGK